MPHSTRTSTSTSRPPPSIHRAHSYTRSRDEANGSQDDGGMEKFPDHIDSHLTNSYSNNHNHSTSPATPLVSNSFVNGRDAPHDRWQSRRESRSVRFPSGPPPINQIQTRHGRQKSLSDAFRTIRSRGGSVSQNAHEIADALRAPVSPTLIILCVLWYASSALTNTSSKTILTAWDQPATLTVIQFAFVSSYCLLFAWLASMFPRLRTNVPALQHGIRYPTRDVLTTTLPLAAFQIFGHLLSSSATSKIPVSLVHTIKGLSPLFTVLAYRFVYNIRYTINTYLSLIPLTIGVMLACSGNHSEYGGELLGLIYALLATIVFVVQNIVSKRLFNEAAKAEAAGLSARSQKLDKLNLLCYSSGIAFFLTAPIWFWTEGFDILKELMSEGAVDLNSQAGAFDHGRLTVEFIFNGTFHFGQNILAFVLLSMVSPVTYSVASLIKRVFVIVVAIVWFRSSTTLVQGVGIALTFLGLYLYDRTHDRDKADRKARMMEIKEEPLLPVNAHEAAAAAAAATTAASRDAAVFENSTVPGSALKNGFTPAVNGDDLKKTDEMGLARPSGSGNHGWLAPGTKQEDTWRMEDRKAGL